MLNTPKNAGLGTLALIPLVVGASLLVPAAPVRSGVMKVGERNQAPAPVVTIRTHPLQGRPAATVFVRNLPMLTFLGQSSGVTTGVKVANTSVVGDPLVPATRLAARLNRLTQQRSDVRHLRVVEGESNQLWLQYRNERLLRFDNTVTFDGLTKDPVQNALQMTNRLRLRLGNAPPLTAVNPTSGQPSPAQRVVGSVRSVLQGWASWYGPGFQGRRTANGERFNPQALTAAHRTLPFGTQVRVTNLRNGRAVVVRINDRGPHLPGREIDISAGAAQVLGMIQMGMAPVRLEVLGP